MNNLYKIYKLYPFNCSIYFFYNCDLKFCLKKLKNIWQPEVIDSFRTYFEESQQGETLGFTIYGTNGNSLIYIGDNSTNTIAHELTHAITYAMKSVGEPFDSETTAYFFGNLIEQALSDTSSFNIRL